MLIDYIFTVSIVVAAYFSLGLAISVLYRFLESRGVGAPIDDREIQPGQIKNELSYGICTCSIAAAYLVLATNFVEPKVALDASIVLMQVLFFAFTYDLYMYVTHRLLHTKSFSKYHGVHHKSVVCTPWSSLSMHPVEALVNYLPFFALPMLMDISAAVLYGVFLYFLAGIIHGHANYDLLARTENAPLLKQILSFHQGHHSRAKNSFGYLYTHWDSVFGTKNDA